MVWPQRGATYLGCVSLLVWATGEQRCGLQSPGSFAPLPTGSLSHSECSTPPQSPLNIDTLSSCSQSQTSASTLPRIAVNPAALGEWRKDR